VDSKTQKSIVVTNYVNQTFKVVVYAGPFRKVSRGACYE